jgi:hypothetical protein
MSTTARAKDRDLVLALGFRVLSELARGFRRREHQPVVIAACRFLSGIRWIEFQPTVQAIVRAEFHRAMTGLELVTVLSPANHLLTRQELTTIAMGPTTADALQFIESREGRVRLHHPQLAAANMKSIRSRVSTVSGNTPARDKINDFRHFTESARRDIFVRDDRDLPKRAQDISPFRPTLSWNDLRVRLG